MWRDVEFREYFVININQLSFLFLLVSLDACLAHDAQVRDISDILKIINKVLTSL